MTNSNLTAEIVRDLLSYNPSTGIFVWKVNRGRLAKAGQIAGSCNRRGYVRLKVEGKEYLAHRLAWFHFYGCWPSMYLDHINQIKSDNRIKNIREATSSQNKQNTFLQSNNTSGFRGVCWHKQSSRWSAKIKINGVSKFLGNFDTPEAASIAFNAAAKELHTHRPKTARAAQGADHG